MAQRIDVPGMGIVEFPDGMSDSDIAAAIKRNMPKPEPTLAQEARQHAGNLAAGAVRGAGSIGATILAPLDMAKDAIAGKGLSLESNRERRKAMDAALQTMGAEPDSWMYQGGKLAGEIAGTSGVGGVLAKGAQGAGVAPALVEALRTGGLSADGLKGAAGLATRTLGGAATGAASAGLVDPEQAGMGAMVGGALPGAVMAAGKTGAALGKALRGGQIAPETKALANRAAELGIDIPADRLANSRLMNALASALNYVPFSGRAAVEDNMAKQLQAAMAKTMGEDTSNITKAVKEAEKRLSPIFDDTLKNNAVRVDDVLRGRIDEIEASASRTLGDAQLTPIKSQIRQILTKGSAGEIDGQAAYNIKRELDTIAKGNGTEASAAKDLRTALMDALNRSLGPEKAAQFAEVRKQWGNMRTIEKVARNGSEGDISIARFANTKDIRNKELSELADIAAQFVKPREGQHGAMQRGMAAIGIGGTLGPAGLAGTVAAGRMANSLMNSQSARDFMLNNGNHALANALRKGAPLVYKAAPVLATE